MYFPALEDRVYYWILRTIVRTLCEPARAEEDRSVKFHRFTSRLLA
jgi:hypothetical protein